MQTAAINLRFGLVCVLMVAASTSFFTSTIGRHALDRLDEFTANRLRVPPEPASQSAATQEGNPIVVPSSAAVSSGPADRSARTSEVEDYAGEPPPTRLRHLLIDLRAESRSLSNERNQLGPNSRAPRLAKSYRHLIDAIDRVQDRIAIVLEVGQGRQATPRQSDIPAPSVASIEGKLSTPPPPRRWDDDGVRVTGRNPVVYETPLHSSTSYPPTTSLIDPSLIVSLISLLLALVVVLWGDNLVPRLMSRVVKPAPPPQASES
jgi:hypothetical protein